MPEAYIFDHIRTPRGKGKATGALHEVPPIELATQVLTGIRDRNDLATGELDDIIFGVVAGLGEQGCGVPRVAALNAGFADSVPGLQLSRFCSSGLEAVNTGAAYIMAGQSKLIIAGGVESMSRVAMGSDGGAWSNDPAITYKTFLVPQGVCADLIATRSGFSRADIDNYAMHSQQRAAHAWKERRFDQSVIPVVDDIGQVLLDKDEIIRASITLSDLEKLPAAFAARGEQVGYDAVALQKYPEIEAISHIHTAGNSSGIVDGAAAVLIGSLEAGMALGLSPRARIRSFTTVGSEPTIMLTGPVPATDKALSNAGMQISDIDLFELNEAFASVPLHYMSHFNIGHEKINVNGGAIAMGHPTGATGAMILGTALDELERSDKETALVSLCVGIGMGTATIIERV